MKGILLLKPIRPVNKSWFCPKGWRLRVIHSYQDDDDLGTAPATPYSVPGVDLDTGTAGCILYSYDIDENDSNPPDDGDRFGFKFENNLIRIRTSAGTASDCGSGNWQTVTDNNVINVTALTFSTASSKCLNASTKGSGNSLCTDAAIADIGAPPAGRTHHYVEVRQVDIKLTGNLVADANISKTIAESIRIRNDRIFDVTTP